MHFRFQEHREIKMVDEAKKKRAFAPGRKENFFHETNMETLTDLNELNQRKIGSNQLAADKEFDVLLETSTNLDDQVELINETKQEALNGADNRNHGRNSHGENPEIPVKSNVKPRQIFPLPAFRGRYNECLDFKSQFEGLIENSKKQMKQNPGKDWREVFYQVKKHIRSFQAMEFDTDELSEAILIQIMSKRKLIATSEMNLRLAWKNWRHPIG